MRHNTNRNNYKHSAKNTKASSNCPKKQQQIFPIEKNCLSETAEWTVSSEPAANMMHYFLLSGNNYSRAMYVARQLSFGVNNSRPRNASIKLFWWHVKIYAHLIHTHDQNQADLQLDLAKPMPHEPVKCLRTWPQKHFQGVQNILKSFILIRNLVECSLSQDISLLWVEIRWQTLKRECLTNI